MAIPKGKKRAKGNIKGDRGGLSARNGGGRRPDPSLHD